MADIDKAVERIEQHDAWDETDEVVPIEVKRPLDKVIPIRLSGDKWQELREEAREMGIGPTTLARMWILERLRRQRAIFLEEQAKARELFRVHNPEVTTREFVQEQDKV